MSQDWEIKPRSDECNKCRTHFVDGQTYHSALFAEKSGFCRKDYCLECWPACRSEHESLYSLWRGVYAAPQPPPEEPLKKETAETLLRRLIEDDDDKHAAVIYVLAAMLERKKILIERDVRTREDGTLMRVYEHRHTGETFVIKDPRLSLDKLEPVQEEIVSLLQGKQVHDSSNGAAAGTNTVLP